MWWLWGFFENHIFNSFWKTSPFYDASAVMLLSNNGFVFRLIFILKNRIFKFRILITFWMFVKHSVEINLWDSWQKYSTQNRVLKIFFVMLMYYIFSHQDNPFNKDKQWMKKKTFLENLIGLKIIKFFKISIQLLKWVYFFQIQKSRKK